MQSTNIQLISGRIKFLFIALLPLIILLAVGQTLLAQGVNDPQVITAAQLTASKTANVSEARAGETVRYTVVISNTGDTTASGAVMTDTLPTEFEVVSGTLTATSWDSIDVVDNVVMWVGSVGGNGGQVQIEFDAVLTDTAIVGELITNTAEITGTGVLLEPYKAIEVSPDTYTMYLPVIERSYYRPVQLWSVGLPTPADNEWNFYDMLITWESLNDADVEYILQASESPDFLNPAEYNVGTATSVNFRQHATFDFPKWYFRVYYVKDGVSSLPSNEISRHGAYHDRFDNSSSGWAMRRADIYDTNDSVYYEDSLLKMKIHGRWDNMIAGTLEPLPTTWNGYEIETRVSLEEGVDNLHTYGIVFGADWDGSSPCPDPSLLTCYNSYYRLSVVWGGNYLKAKLKRIDSHDPGEDTDSGETLMSFRDLRGMDVDPNGYNTWNIEVSPDGTIELYVNGHYVYTAHDTRYIGGGRYFGTYASSNEYLGTAAWYEYYKVTPLP